VEGDATFDVPNKCISFQDIPEPSPVLLWKRVASVRKQAAHSFLSTHPRSHCFVLTRALPEDPRWAISGCQGNGELLTNMDTCHCKI
jgi:uncharacterized protein with HEPN domain